MPNPALSTIDVRRVAHPKGGVYADFVVDGLSLSTRANRKSDLVGVLGWGDAAAQDAAVVRLLLEAPADTCTGRVSLYVCKECGGLDCGAMSVRVIREHNVVTWSDFYYEGADATFAANNRFLEDLGPYHFSWRLYEAAVRYGRDIVSTHSAVVRWLSAEQGGRAQLPPTLRWVGISRFAEQDEHWPDGSWSIVLTFDFPPAECSAPMPAKARFLFSETAPQAWLRPGVNFSIYDGIKRIGDVEVLD
jgi:hypothetical protein